MPRRESISRKKEKSAMSYTQYRRLRTESLGLAMGRSLVSLTRALSVKLWHERPPGVGLKEKCRNRCEGSEFRCFFQGVLL